MKQKLQKYTAEVVETMPVNPSFRPEIGVGNIIKSCLRETLSLTHQMAPSSCLEFEDLGLLPAEALVREVSILGCLEIDGLGQVELLDNHTRAEIKVLVDDIDQLI
jgi:hypothetical protein